MASATALAAALIGGCSAPVTRNQFRSTEGPRHGRLRARPGASLGGEIATGVQPLGLATDRDGFVFLPAAVQAGQPLPLVVMLHGAGGNGMHGLGPFLDRAEDAAVILLAPESRGGTWDALLGAYGPDVAFIDRALEQTFTRVAVDAGRVAIEGFSDGASYALGLGLANGDLFRRVVAFSPGFAPPGREEGRPPVYISHGIDDDVLPIDRCSRRIVPSLRRRGYDVRYREFDGGHEIPADVIDEAFTWLRDAG